VPGMHHLRVLDAVPSRAQFWRVRKNTRVEVEHRAVRRVTDGVDGGLEAAPHERGDPGLVEAGISPAHAAVAGPVRVILEQPRSTGAQRAIVERLHPGDAQPRGTGRVRTAGEPRIDRKSTRLNSTHVK